MPQLVYQMSNIKEFKLDEFEIHVSWLEEAISCLLHTILFLRNPKKVTPSDISCSLLAPLTYTTCGMKTIDVDIKKVFGT